jgi:soluble cytochrome b562
MIDLGQYDAMKSTPSSKKEQERAFTGFKERMEAYKQWMDIADKLPTLGEIDERTNRS